MENNKHISMSTMREIQDGDLVKGIDNKWYPVTVLPIKIKQLYIVKTTAGNITCSNEHEWVLCTEYGKNILSTQQIFDNLTHYIGQNIGIKSGPNLLSVEKSKKGECRCIQTEAPEHQFEVYTDQGKPIFTHNCQARIVCGKLSNATASMMALGNSLATTIDGNRKGAGIVSVSGVMSNVQYYFAPTSWIQDWYEARGLDKDGYEIGKHEVELDDSSLSGEEEFSISDDDKHFEFEQESKDILNKQEQKFENI